jgi:hypothetical protein
VGIFLARQVEQAPGPPGEDDSVDVHVILNQILEVVVCFRERFLGHRGKRPLSPFHIPSPRGVAQGFAVALSGRKLRGCDRVQNFVRVAPHLLDVVRIAIKHLHDRQGLVRLWQLARHLVGRNERHHRVVALVILASKGPGICQGGGGDQAAEVCSRLHLLDDRGKQLVNRGVLHQSDQRLDRPEGQPAGRVVRQRAGGQPQILGHDLPHAGEQHAPAHIREELTTVTALHDRSLLEKIRKNVGQQNPVSRSSVQFRAIRNSLCPVLTNAAVLHDFHCSPPSS